MESVMETGESVRVNTRLLKVLVTGQHRYPRFVLTIPEDDDGSGGRRSFREFFKPSRLFQQRFKVYFVCAVSLKLGTPYSFKMTKDWVVKLAPVLKVGIMLLKVAAASAGLPLPNPLPSSVGGVDLSKVQFLDNLLSSVQESAMEKGQEAALESIDDVMQSMSDASSRGEEILQLQQNKLNALTEPSYLELYQLLLRLEEVDSSALPFDWTPPNTGLNMVTSDKDGSVAWVHPSAEAEFHRDGAQALKLG